MNRDALDEFFAKADDVLTDWHGSDDSMSTYMTRPRPAVDHGLVTLIIGPSQESVERFRRAMVRFEAAFRSASLSLLGCLDGLITDELSPADHDVRARALELRRNRNTGPTSRVGLDGHHHRGRRRSEGRT